ncbi:hypothetical protein NKI54_33825 [Mesorhizobium sp. M0663]|uniref:hypothetical protein n=1 Tax=Mesorhizobium sp. M0663 TaxID=2956981 RepID=UPI003337F39E
MAVNDVELFPSFVWGEASGLTAQGNEPDKAQDRLWSVLTFIAKNARPRGLLGQMKRAGPLVNADEADNYTRMKMVVKKVVEEKYDGPALPQQAALWQIDANSRPLFDPSDAGRAPPSWIFQESTRQAGEFSSKAGLRYRLFEMVDPPADGRLGYVSSYSLTGLTIRTWTVPRKMRIAAWVIGIAASILFVLGCILATGTGRIDGTVRWQMSSTGFQYDIVRNLADICVSDQKLFPNWKRRACSFLEDGSGKYVIPATVKTAAPAAPASNPQATSESQSPVDDAPASTEAKNDVKEFGDKVGEAIQLIRKCLNVGIAAPPDDTKTDADAATTANDAASCELIARSAGNLVPIKAQTSFLDSVVATIIGVKNVAGTRSILLQLFCATLGIAGLAIALGLGTKGRVDGIWIDERNRVSLARAQVTLWTIVALGGFATIALFNVGLGAPTSFPQIPASIAAALGIAFASPMISALILNSRGLEDVTTIGASKRDTKDFSDRGSFLAAPSTALDARDDPTEASIADVFMGEQVADSAYVDISRLQNVVLTVTLVLGYFAMLTEQLRAIAPDSILTGLVHLPDPGAAFTAVLLVSHATYLGTKVYKTTPGSGEADG